MGKGDPLSVAVPVPRGVLELAGQIRGALGDAKGELKVVLQQIKDAQAAGKTRREYSDLTARKYGLQEEIYRLKNKEEAQKAAREETGKTLAAVDGLRSRVDLVQRLATGRIGLADFEGAARAVQRAGVSLASMGATRTGGLLARVGSTLAGGISTGTAVMAGGIGAAMYGTYGFIQNQYQEMAKSQTAQAAVDQQWTDTYRADRFGSRYSAQDMLDIEARRKHVREIFGPNSSWRGGRFTETLANVIFGTSSGAVARAAKADAYQTSAEQFARQRGVSWQARLSVEAMARDPRVQREIDRELGRTGVYEWSPSVWLKRKVFEGVGTAGGMEWEQELRKEKAIEYGEKDMKAELEHINSRISTVQQKPEYQASQQLRSLALRGMEDLQHGRYLQWNPY
jgi:hypothetical protein